MPRRVAETLIPAFGDPPPTAALEAAARILAEGWPVGLPTDTVYGLAVDPFRPGATDRVFAVKRRPRDVRLPVLVAGREQALALAGAVPDAAMVLMERFWPGALTIVLPGRPDRPVDLGDRGDGSVGVRCPDHALARALCELTGPLATTSANLHGTPVLTTAGQVASVFGASVPVVLDGGACSGRPSTVVDCTTDDARVLREGRIAWDELRAALG